MAGIIASSATKTMASGDTSADGSVSGYIVGEQITLSTTPTGTNYSWGEAIPSASATARSKLSATTGASVTFTPDVAGYYTITCIVDSLTTYVLRLSVTQATAAVSTGATNYPPVVAGSVPSPQTGVTIFVDSATITLTQKTTNGVAMPLAPGIVASALADENTTIAIGEGSHFVLPDGTLSANRTVALGTTGASLGHVIWVHRLDATAFTLAITNTGAGGGTLVTFPASEMHSMSFAFDGTDWALSSRYKLA